MRIVMLACTKRGFEIMGRAAEGLQDRYPEMEILRFGRSVHVPGFEEGPSLAETTAAWFERADALIYFAAAGIAVRCIAPHVRDKFTDPAVLAVDENGRFVISLLSGHAGGANRICLQLAEVLGAQAVITTATDAGGLFAVDVFAKEYGLRISDREAAKRISADILAGKKRSICFDPFLLQNCGSVPEKDVSAGSSPQDQDLPAEDTLLRGPHREDCRLPENEMERPDDLPARVRSGQFGAGIHVTKERGSADILVSFRKLAEASPDALYLIPPAVALGIGCRKGTTAEEIGEAVSMILRKTGIFPQALCGIASIDLKKDEPGLHDFAEEQGLPLRFYTAEEMRAVQGTFSASSFVQSVTGVDCVCERSAVLLAGEIRESGSDREGGEGGADEGSGEGRESRESRADEAGGKGTVLLEKKFTLGRVTAALACTYAGKMKTRP